MASLIALAVFYLAAVFADFLSPYPYDNEERSHPNAPPTPLRFRRADGSARFLPFVYRTSYTFDENRGRVYVEDRSAEYPIRFFIPGEEHRILGLIPTRIHFFGVDAPARIYLLGADYLGRDRFSRILYGSRISLSIGLVGVSVSFVIGMLVGGIAGYFGGAVDNALMRVVEMVMLIPRFYLLLALRAALPEDISSVRMYFYIVFILSFLGWAGTARVVRGMVLSLREQDYVIAARALGRGHLWVIVRHILPNTLSYAIVSVTLAVPSGILGESALSLLGLGIQEPYASWGNMLAKAMNVAEIQFNPEVLWPGAFIFAVVMCFQFLGDGLRDAFDPMMEASGVKS